MKQILTVFLLIAFSISAGANNSTSTDIMGGGTPGRQQENQESLEMYDISDGRDEAEKIEDAKVQKQEEEFLETKKQESESVKGLKRK